MSEKNVSGGAFVNAKRDKWSGIHVSFIHNVRQKAIWHWSRFRVQMVSRDNSALAAHNVPYLDDHLARHVRAVDKHAEWAWYSNPERDFFPV